MKILHPFSAVETMGTLSQLIAGHFDLSTSRFSCRITGTCKHLLSYSLTSVRIRNGKFHNFGDTGTVM